MTVVLTVAAAAATAVCRNMEMSKLTTKRSADSWEFSP
jgi:hypothetical protein